MVRNLFSSVSNSAKSFFSSIANFPSFVKKTLHNIVNNFQSLRYRLANMAESNVELGIYHLRSRNWNDAIFRFKMVNKFLDPNNKIANYWLGWVYFLKQSYKNSIIHLTKAENEDKVGLLQFVKSIDSVTYIPSEIHALHRDIMAELFIDKFASDEINLPKELILRLEEGISELPEEYTILELGSNIGLLGNEINKRMQESYDITSTEVSAEMIKLQAECFPDQQLYDTIIQSSINEFLEQSTEQYDVILSLDGFVFESDLKNIFSNVFSRLKPGGYFAFSVPSTKGNTFSQKRIEFSYDNQQISNQLSENGFNILSAKEFTLEIKNNYSIFVCTK